MTRPHIELGTRRTAVGGALLLTVLLMLFTLGRFNTGDAEGMFQVTAGLAEDGIPWQHGNHEWIKFGIGQPVATLPLYWLGRFWAGVTHADVEQLTRFCVSLFNQIVIAATALVLFVGSRARYGTGIALAISGTFLLATPAVPYARLAFAEPLSALLILCAAMLLWRPGQPTVSSRQPAVGRRQMPYWPVAGAGLCLGLAVLVKPANLIYVPVPALYVAWMTYRQSRGSLGGAVSLRRTLTGPVCFLLGLLPGLVATGGYNMVRYGSPFVFGYEGEGFTTPLPVGLYGLLFSPGKGIIFFAPPVVLGAIALAYLWRSGNSWLRAEVLYVSCQAAIVLVFHALWSSWEGNIAWGPRLILPVVPLLLWPLGAISGIGWARAAWWALAAVGFLVAIPGALVDQYYYFDINSVYGAGTAAENHMLFWPEWSQIVAHWRFILTGTREAITRPALASMGLSARWDLLVPALLVVAALACLVLMVPWRLKSRGAGDDPTSKHEA